MEYHSADSLSSTEKISSNDVFFSCDSYSPYYYYFNFFKPLMNYNYNFIASSLSDTST